MKNNFENLIREVREKNYITPVGNKMLLSYENVQKLKDSGFEINEEIIDKLMDEFHNEKFKEAIIKKDLKNVIVNKSFSKLVKILIQALMLILLMALIYFLVPSFDNKSQTRDEDSLYQNNYR